MRSVNLDHLRTYVTVIERGSLTAAAKQLNLSQPAVTHQIQELEKRFRVPLVERLGKRAFATTAGEKLIERARVLLDEETCMQDIMYSFSKNGLERVRIGTSATVLMYALPPILRELKNARPQLELNIKAGLTSGTLKLLKENALDIGLCALPIADPAFDTEFLFEDELVAILPPATRNVPRRATPEFVSQQPLILGNEHSALRRDVTDWLASDGRSAQALMAFDNVEAIKSLVAVGLGASIVPSLALGEGHVSASKIIAVPLKPHAGRRVGLVRIRNKPITIAMGAVIEALLTLRQNA